METLPSEKPTPGDWRSSGGVSACLSCRDRLCPILSAGDSGRQPQYRDTTVEADHQYTCIAVDEAVKNQVW